MKKLISSGLSLIFSLYLAPVSQAMRNNILNNSIPINSNLINMNEFLISINQFNETKIWCRIVSVSNGFLILLYNNFDININEYWNIVKDERNTPINIKGVSFKNPFSAASYYLKSKGFVIHYNPDLTGISENVYNIEYGAVYIPNSIFLNKILSTLYKF